jgi:hypothetical protein
VDTPGEDDPGVPGDFDVHVLEVVLPGTPDADVARPGIASSLGCLKVAEFAHSHWD